MGCPGKRWEGNAPNVVGENIVLVQNGHTRSIFFILPLPQINYNLKKKKKKKKKEKKRLKRQTGLQIKTKTKTKFTNIYAFALRASHKITFRTIECKMVSLFQ